MTSTWVSSWGPLMAQTKKYLLRGSPSQHPGQGCPFQTSGWGCAHSGLWPTFLLSPGLSPMALFTAPGYLNMSLFLEPGVPTSEGRLVTDIVLQSVESHGTRKSPQEAVASDSRQLGWSLQPPLLQPCVLLPEALSCL